MGEYRFVVGNVFMIAFFALLLGPMGMAEDIYGEELDFDTDRLGFDITDDFEIETGNLNALVWDQSENDRGDEYGYIVYDVEDLDSFKMQTQTGRWSFSSRIDALILPEGSGEVDSVTIFDGGNDPGRFFGEDTEQIEIRISGDRDSHALVDVSEPDVDLDSFTDSDSVEERQVDVDESMFESIRSAVSTSSSAIIQLPQVISAWVAFGFSIPGLLGTLLRWYIAGLVVYLLVTEVWIG